MQQAALRESMRHVQKRSDCNCKLRSTLSAHAQAFELWEWRMASSRWMPDFRTGLSNNYSSRNAPYYSSCSLTITLAITHQIVAQDRHTACCTLLAGRLHASCDLQLLPKHALVAAMALSMQKTALVQTPMVSRVSSRSQAARAAVPRRQVQSNSQVTAHLTGYRGGWALKPVATQASSPICPILCALVAAVLRKSMLVPSANMQGGGQWNRVKQSVMRGHA